MTRPTVWVVGDISSSGHGGAAGRRHVALADVPRSPFRLDGMVVCARVDTPASVIELLHAVVRGASAVLSLALDDAAATAFLDELHRVATVDAGAAALTLEQRELIDLLRAGLSLGAAARHLGWSRRTADRRLSDARVALGARTTAEALARVDRTAPSIDERAR